MTYTADDFTDEQLRAGRVAAIALSGLGLSATFAKLDELTAAIATALTSTGWVPVQESRPLTPDDITDEMASRAIRKGIEFGWFVEGDVNVRGVREKTRAILTAALTDPPARPEGAEELGELIGEWTATEDAPQQIPTGTFATLADFLAERVTITPKEQS